MLLVPFHRIITEEEMIKGMDKPPYWVEEAPGLFCWAVVGLWRLREQGRFTESKVCTKALEAYRNEANPARAYLQGHWQEAPEKKVPCAELYQAYRQWCHDNGYSPLSNGYFAKEVYRTFPSCQSKYATLATGSRAWVFIGIQRAEDQF
jgi:putative DNA primase/helicase